MTFLEKIKQLPLPISTFFLSDQPRHELEKSFYIYGIDDDVIAKIAPKIGLLYINELDLKDLPLIISRESGIKQDLCYGIAYEINVRIFNKFPEFFNDAPKLLRQWENLKSTPVISENEAWAKILELEPWILEEEQEQKQMNMQVGVERQRQQASLITITIEDGLKQFPELGEQLITSEKITLKNFPEPVRPSIKNWLADYTFRLGYDKRDAIMRGNYLFHSDNTIRLSSADREKLSYVLKAHDEDLQVTVNKNTKQIVFSTTNKTQETRYNNQTNSNIQYPNPDLGHSVSNDRNSQRTPSVPRQTASGIPNPAYRPLSVSKDMPAKPAEPMKKTQLDDLHSDYFHKNSLD